jgi:hypothetical protein
MNISIPKRAEDRLAAGIKKFQPIVQAALKRDANESDTSTIIIDMLSDVFGFDKYSEVTTEYAIRGTYCDVAIKLDGANKPSILIEIKAVGIPPDEKHIKQAIDYAANQGVDWVILSTGVCWILYKVVFGKPIGQEEVLSFNFLEIDPKKDDSLCNLYALSKDGWTKELPAQIQAEKEVLSRYNLGALLLSDPILDCFRRELRRLAPEVKTENEQLCKIFENEIIKREVLEGDKAEAASRRISRHLNKAKKVKAASESSTPPIETSAVPEAGSAPTTPPPTPQQ